MQVLLLTKDLQAGNQIKQRLYFEGMPIDIKVVEDWSSSEVFEVILKFKVILIHTNEMIENGFLQKCEIFLNKKLFILIDENYNFTNQESQKIFRNIFYKPIDYFNLIFSIRNGIFNMQKFNCPQELSFKKIVLNLENRNLIAGTKSIFLRNKEFALMRFFLENPGRLLTRMSILENVWDINADLFTNTVDVHVSRLRKLLLKLDDENAYIKTIPCSGYVFE